MREIWIGIACWLGGMNLLAFGAMGADKRRARLGRWRIRERTLFLLALLGGGAGAVLGMRVFHHKTRHWYFRVGMPVILALQLAVIALAGYLSLRGAA